MSSRSSTTGMGRMQTHSQKSTTLTASRRRLTHSLTAFMPVLPGRHARLPAQRKRSAAPARIASNSSALHCRTRAPRDAAPRLVVDEPERRGNATARRPYGEGWRQDEQSAALRPIDGAPVRCASSVPEVGPVRLPIPTSPFCLARARSNSNPGGAVQVAFQRATSVS